MPAAAPAPARSTSALPWAVAFAVLLQLLARFGPSPVADFTLDDWAILQRTESVGGAAASLEAVRRDADRPLAAGMLTLLFGLFGDRPEAFTLFSMAAYSLAMLLHVRLIHALTGSVAGSLAGGAALALLPNCTESFNWPTMIGYALAYAGYAGAALAWVHYTRTGAARWLAAAALAFAFALFQYEIGLGLPAAFAVLLLPAILGRRAIAGLGALGAVALAYLAWRFTEGFGTAPGFLFESRPVHFTFFDLLWNLRDTAFWWIGPKFWRCLHAGWSGFALLPRATFFLFLAINLAAAAALVRALRAPDDTAARPAADLRPAAGFFAVWFGVCVAINLVSWNCGRLNLLPGMGLAGLIGVGVAAYRPRPGLAAAALAALLLMGNQGTAEQWRQSGEFHRRLYNHLAQHRAEWIKKDAVWLDTTALRQRLTADLLQPPSTEQEAWAFYGNAGLIRGFGLGGMVKRLAAPAPAPLDFLDVEFGARAEGGRFLWHDRFNPDRPHAWDLQRVYRVDCFAAGLTP